MMDWLNRFQLFLFDFDGLLVNTEEIHYLAYKQMFAKRGIALNLSFEEYCKMAHYTPTGLKDRVCTEFPEIVAQAGGWDLLYQEKKQGVVNLYEEGAVHPMPGVVRLLTELQERSIPRCVVTHSADVLVNAARKKNNIFDTIPYWITRADYTHPKPHSECYLKAIQLYGTTGGRVIGFEDSPRGLRSLLGTPALSVLICSIPYPEITSFIGEGARHFTTFDAIPDNWNP